MFRPTLSHASLDRSRAEGRPVAPAFVVEGRFNLRAIMVEAVRVARTLRAGGASWQWRMKVALRAVWSRAREALASGPAPVAKMELDRGDVLKLLARIAAHPANAGRDLLAGSARKRTADLLMLARAEYRLIPHPDRPALLANLQAPPTTYSDPSVGLWRPREWSWWGA